MKTTKRHLSIDIETYSSTDIKLCLLYTSKDLLKEIKDEEEAAYEIMPECLQVCDHGEHLQENVNALQKIVNTLDSVTDNLADVD